MSINTATTQTRPEARLRAPDFPVPSTGSEHGRRPRPAQLPRALLLRQFQLSAVRPFSAESIFRHFHPISCFLQILQITQEVRIGLRGRRTGSHRSSSCAKVLPLQLGPRRLLPATDDVTIGPAPPCNLDLDFVFRFRAPPCNHGLPLLPRED